MPDKMPLEMEINTLFHPIPNIDFVLCWVEKAIIIPPVGSAIYTLH